VWAQGSFVELCERFGVGATRVSTDKPEVLAEVLKEIEYVKRVRIDTRGIFLDVEEGSAS
jgi:hypothetical protein